MRLSRIFVLLLSMACLCGNTAIVRSADQEVEYKVMAAFLLNFAKFTTWPASTWPGESTPFTLCIVGNDPFGSALDGIEQKEIGGRKISLQKVPSVTDVPGQCQILFVSGAEPGQVESLLTLLGRKPIVTVSDIEGFATRGGMIEFKNKDDRLSFLINNRKAKENDLQFSASLLHLAIDVF